MIRVFEAFTGYGSQSIALRNLGIEHEVVAISEIDKYAIKAYEAIHGPVLNLGDICKIDPKDIPQHDLFTYSFPCQDLSVAGKRAGLGKGTRSGLLYECEKIIEHCRPKYLLLENVKNLVGKKFKPQFEEWLEYLEGLGYTNYWQVLNAKNYGVPQNRERVFVVSVLGEHKPYEFPKAMPLDKCIADILEDEVAEKYYLSDEVLRKFKPNKNFLTQKDNPVAESKILDVEFIKKSEDGKKHQSNTVIHEDYLMRTLTACDWKPPQLIITDVIKEVSSTSTTNKGEGQKIICEQRSDEGLRFFKDNICGTIRTINSGGDKRVIEGDFKIRKLTPRECFRLMGMRDDDIDKIQQAGISNSQQYKMAGNSIVVDVLEAIFKNLFKGE